MQEIKMETVMKKKSGVKTEGLKRAMDHPLKMYNLLCKSHCVEPVVTDAVSQRSNPSLHPLGYAVDLRFREFLKPYHAVEIFKILIGDDYDFIYYDKTKHLHVEYQLFLDMSKKTRIKFMDENI